MRDGDESTSVEPARDQDESAKGIDYAVEFSGFEPPALLALVRESSQLLALTERKPGTRTALERRVRSDIETFDAIFRSEGYYDARVEYRIDEASDPVTVAIDATPGPLYKLVRYRIAYSGTGSQAKDLVTEMEELGLAVNQPARAEAVVAARRRLLDTLAYSGRPLARVLDQRVTVDHADRSMSVEIDIEPGDLARFSAPKVIGSNDVKEDYVLGFVPWQPGDTYSRRQVDRLSRDLIATGLFGSVAIEQADALAADGTLPITIRLTERERRSVGLGGSYSTDEGLAVEAFWEHRNLFGRAERLTISGEIGDVRQRVDAEFLKPRFLRPDQSLVANGSLGNENTDAYTGPLTTGFAGLEREYSRYWLLTLGIASELSSLSDFQGEREFLLVGAVFSALRDSADDPLNPRDGARLRLRLTPYFGIGDSGVEFLSGVVSGTAYHSPGDADNFILAGRVRLASVAGEPSDALPANQRLYAGGGGSVRGYAYQSLGPRAPTGQPIGGRSLVELSAEARLAFSDSLGGAVFVDGGNAYESVLPDFSEPVRWAVGLGARYFTGFGPLRVDIAFPIDRRREFDDPFQLYVSIGQAF
ncbi:MAG: autotransporter assembly complex family protein [Gammaproteobacteria bacterium]|nr:autotransporter assembly complex family protein [Gammaproteobacteria bacterium]